MVSSETDASTTTHNIQSTHTNTHSASESNGPNPYFFNSNENPSNILVTQPLLGMRNYHSWSQVMVLALTAKKKISFVNGKISKPEDDSPLYEDWESCNTMVLSWLINSMHVDVSSNIMYCETAREMWLELKRLYLQGNGPKVYNLQREISHFTESDDS
ncbi:uncharacterized protein LOC111998064 [Quercus suber]|uniref:uncharacterized protein LOC111998064 n=1 Tax=Quercus suber TaxID=58331 RepID=UPI000CE18D50|nr:uncharacterized protein LOC111998064 [Quercus suber]